MDGQKSNKSQNLSHSSVKEYTPRYVHTTITSDMVPLIILGALIILISGLIIISFIMNKRLKERPANVMIFSQACTDVFTALVFIPLNLVQNGTAKTLSLFLGCYMLYLSLFNLALISVDRYLALNRPFLHRKFISVKNTSKTLIVVWLAPFGVILIPLFWWFGNMHTKKKATRIYICTIWSLMLVLVVLMTVLYVLATKGAKHTIRNRRISVSSITKDKAAALAQKELRVVHLFGLLLFFFLLAYLPILYINFCHIIDAHKYSPPELEVVSLYLLICNSVLNPTICIVLKKDYLYAIKKILPYIQEDYSSPSSSDTWSLASYGSEPNLKGKISNTTGNSPSIDSNTCLRKYSCYDRPYCNDQRVANDRKRKCLTNQCCPSDNMRSPSDRNFSCNRMMKYSSQSPAMTPIQITKTFGTRQKGSIGELAKYSQGKNPSFTSKIRKTRTNFSQIELMEMNNLINRE